MWTLIIGAVRARTAQVLTVFVLTALAAAIAAAGPWFGFASMSSAAAADVVAAPAEQRT
jgi:putative ABC transport system permease protein